MTSFSSLEIAGRLYLAAPPPLHLAATLYADINDQAKHRRIIEILARDTERSVWEVTPLYETIFARLKAQARIPDYLPVLAAKKVKSLLQ